MTVPNSIPWGLSFNPSSRAHRLLHLLPFVATGLLISAYLAFAQMDAISPWDPFFQDGTRRVLHSSVSSAFPVPDALLGFIAYSVEWVLLLLGPDDRWLKHPILTLLYGSVATCLAGASLILLFMQPVMVGTWCSPCLLLAFVALMILQRSTPELLAAVQGLILRSAPERPALFLWTEHSTTPWTLYVSLLLGIATLTFTSLFSVSGIGAGTLYFSGILVIASSILAFSEPLRVLRWGNGAAGSLLLFWFLGEPWAASRWIACIIGLALMGLCIPAGRRVQGTLIA